MEEQRKSFSSMWKHQVVLTFPNGNCVSTIWGYGSYSDNHMNHDLDEGLVREPPLAQSNTAEIMLLNCDSQTGEKIYKELEDKATGNIYTEPFGHLTLEEWLWVVNQLSINGGNDQ